MKKRKAIEVPELSQLEEELSRVKYQKRYKRVLTSTVSTLIVVAAVAVLIATLDHSSERDQGILCGQ